MKSELTDLATYIRQPQNPKDHSLDKIILSFKRFGFVDPVVVNSVSGHILAGHGRVDALQSMKAAGHKPPKNIIDKDGHWFVPTWYAEVEEKDEVAAGIALNHIEEDGGWHHDTLASVLSDLAARDETALLATGYDRDDVDTLLASLQSNDISTEQLDEKEPEEKMDVYKLTIACKTEENYLQLALALGVEATGKSKTVQFEDVHVEGLDL